MQDFGNDIKSGFESLTGGDDKTAADANGVYNGQCPPVQARTDLKDLFDFYNPEKPSDASKISEIHITDVKNSCRVEGESLVMQIDLALTGKVGPKARVKATDKPSFAYPYFVAVTDADGVVVAKEIFAASIAYAPNQNEITQRESVFQTMPIPDEKKGQSYNVIVGFQLTPEQLAYNNSHTPQTAIAPAAAPVVQANPPPVAVKVPQAAQAQPPQVNKAPVAVKPQAATPVALPVPSRTAPATPEDLSKPPASLMPPKLPANLNPATPEAKPAPVSTPAPKPATTTKFKAATTND